MIKFRRYPLVAAAVLIGNSAYAQMQAPVWTPAGNMALAPEPGFSSVTLLTGEPAVLAGAGPYSGTISVIRILDMATNEWRVNRVPPMCEDCSAAVLPNGTVLLGSQLVTSQGPQEDLRRMTYVRRGYTATNLLSGSVLVTGGRLGGATAERFDPITRLWRLLPSMASGRENHTATLLGDGRVLVVGGRDGENVLASAEVFDPVVGTWLATSRLASPRAYHSAILLPDGRVMVSGGSGSPGPGTALQSVEFYDPSSNTWSIGPSMARPRLRHTTSLTASARVLAAGGSGDELAPTSSELFDPDTNSWSPGPLLAGPRVGHQALQLPGGDILVVGGSCDPCSERYSEPRPAGAPVIASVTSSGIQPGASAVLLTVSGRNFTPGLTARLAGGPPILTLYISGQRLYVMVPIELAAPGGQAELVLTNGSSSPVASTSITIPSVNVKAKPEIRGLSPSTIQSEPQDAVIEVQGSGFERDSIVLVGGRPIPTEFISPSRLRAILPASLRLGEVTLLITVRNLLPGGGDSAGLPLSVTTKPFRSRHVFITGLGMTGLRVRLSVAVVPAAPTGTTRCRLDGRDAILDSANDARIESGNLITLVSGSVSVLRITASGGAVYSGPLVLECDRDVHATLSTESLDQEGKRLSELIEGSSPLFAGAIAYTGQRMGKRTVVTLFNEADSPRSVRLSVTYRLQRICFVPPGQPNPCPDRIEQSTELEVTGGGFSSDFLDSMIPSGRGLENYGVEKITVVSPEGGLRAAAYQVEGVRIQRAPLFVVGSLAAGGARAVHRFAFTAAGTATDQADSFLTDILPKGGSYSLTLFIVNPATEPEADIARCSLTFAGYRASTQAINGALSVTFAPQRQWTYVTGPGLHTAEVLNAPDFSSSSAALTCDRPVLAELIQSRADSSGLSEAPIPISIAAQEQRLILDPLNADSLALILANVGTDTARVVVAVAGASGVEEHPVVLEPSRRIAATFSGLPPHPFPVTVRSSTSGIVTSGIRISGSVVTLLPAVPTLP